MPSPQTTPSKQGTRLGFILLQAAERPVNGRLDLIASHITRKVNDGSWISLNYTEWSRACFEVQYSISLAGEAEGREIDRSD